MAEVAAHKYEPTSRDQNECQLCHYRSGHPVHALASRDYEVFVDGVCKHESWECSGSSPWVRHECSDCNWCWTNLNNPGFVYCDECSREEYPRSKEYVTKDSGERKNYESGMKRDVTGDKPRFDLILPLGIPYRDQFLTRVAGLLARGAEKYTERNWELAKGEAELADFKSSALRHLMQWLADETDEDHAAAVVFNLLGAETVKWKMTHDKD